MTAAAPNNRTLRLTAADRERLRPRLLDPTAAADLIAVRDRTIRGDALAVLDRLPAGCVDLVFADPPYNLRKVFAGATFNAREPAAYEAWLEGWVAKLPRLLAAGASVYVCAEWRCSAAVQAVCARHFTIRNRITWQREKGRGARRNWKNAGEDIWFCTAGDDYTFNMEAVKLRRRVLAPYRDARGEPKDWARRGGQAVRDTCPSNVWTDLTVPFWSMPENTDHPAQKPEKLLAKVILASSHPGDLVLDPFLGSGTTSVVARKLGRHFIGVEAREEYCLLAERRLERAAEDPAIQGYEDGVFHHKA